MNLGKPFCGKKYLSIAGTMMTLVLGLAMAGQVWAADPTGAPASGGGLSAIKSGVTKTAGGAGLGSSQGVTLESVIGSLISAVLSLVGIILLCYLIYGGFRWMTAGGDAKGVSEAQAIIKNAVIGIIIIAAAYFIADFVLRMLANATSATPTGAPATK
jgi:hypothetical protein